MPAGATVLEDRLDDGAVLLGQLVGTRVGDRLVEGSTWTCRAPSAPGHTAPDAGPAGAADRPARASRSGSSPALSILVIVPTVAKRPSIRGTRTIRPPAGLGRRRGPLGLVALERDRHDHLRAARRRGERQKGEQLGPSVCHSADYNDGQRFRFPRSGFIVPPPFTEAPQVVSAANWRSPSASGATMSTCCSSRPTSSAATASRAPGIPSCGPRTSTGSPPSGVSFRRHFANAAPCGPSRAVALHRHVPVQPPGRDQRLARSTTASPTSPARPARLGYEPALFGYTDIEHRPPHRRRRRSAPAPPTRACSPASIRSATCPRATRRRGSTGCEPAGYEVPDNGATFVDQPAAGTKWRTQYDAEHSQTAFLTERVVDFVGRQAATRRGSCTSRTSARTRRTSRRRPTTRCTTPRSVPDPVRAPCTRARKARSIRCSA